MSEAERAALERLLEHAQRDTGQSARVADFLLAWWNAGTCGAYAINVGWGVDDAIAEDMCTVFRLATFSHAYPDTLGYKPQFEAIVRAWRPELASAG